MRGHDEQAAHLFSYVSPEERIPEDHPLRAIRQMTDRVLATLSPEFTRMYSKIGRPSIAPEKLLGALLLQVLYTVRSERLLMEQLEYNLLFRWFIGLNVDDPVWDPTVFSNNRDRLLAADVAALFFQAVLNEAKARDLVSDEHFTVDGTLLEAWASLKSFKKVGDDDLPPPDDPRQSDGEFSRGDPDQCDACLDDRSGREAGAQGQRQRGQVELLRERTDGKP
jgi:transposase